MKKNILLLCVLCLAWNAHAQRNGLNKHQQLTWLGIDFTQLRFIGTAAQYEDMGEITNHALREKYFPGWNNLILREPSRYDIGKASGFDEVVTGTDATRRANQRNTSANYFSDNSNEFRHLGEKDIARLVEGYDFGEDVHGTGLLVFAEAMDKDREQASLWVAFVDIDSRRLLATRNYTERAGGMGFRNYWAGTFLHLFRDMRGDF